MKKVNQSKVEVQHRKSPKGSFEIFRRHISVALGGTRDMGSWGGGHPFEVELAVPSLRQLRARTRATLRLKKKEKK